MKATHVVVAAVLALLAVLGIALVVPGGMGDRLAEAHTAGAPLTGGWLDALLARALSPLEALALAALAVVPVTVLGVRTALRWRQTSYDLERSRQEHADLVNHNPIAIVSHDGTWVSYANPMARALMGISPDEDLVGRRLSDFVHPDDKAFSAERIDMLKGDVRHLPAAALRLRRPDGEILDVEVEAWRTDVGGRTTYQSTIRDMTERREARRALSATQSRLRQFLEISSDWYWEMDADLRFTYFSDRVGEVLDVDPLSLLGKSRVDLSVGSGDDDRESMEHHLQSIHRREPFRDFVYELEDSTGRKRTVRVNGVPVFSATGDFQGYRGTGTDITRETEAAARAEKARAQLIDAIESVSEGFVLWDADDKLVVVNNQYRKTFPSLTGVMRVGESFESILREGVRQKLYTVADGDLNAWMERRVRDHRDPGPPFEVQLSNGQWTRITERRTADGGTVGTYFDMTARKATADTLRKLSSAVEQSPAAVMITDTKGVIEYVNPTFLESSGFRRDEVLGKTPRIKKSGRMDESFYGEMWNTILSGRQWRGEILNRRRNGDLMWEDTSVSPIFDKKGEITHFVAVQDDVTERRRTREALRWSQIWLTNAQRIAHMGSWERDLRSNKVHWSAETYRIFGRDPGTFTVSSEAAEESVHPEDRSRVRATSQQGAREGRPYSMDYRIVMPDGSIRHIHERAEFTFDESGAPARVSGTVQDVTERLRTAERLRASERQLRDILEASPIAVCITRPGDSRIVFGNNRLAVLYGLDPDHMIGTDCTDFMVNPEEWPAIQAEMDTVTALRDREVERRRSDGSRFWILLSLDRIRFENADAILWWAYDITDQKKAREQLQRMAHVDTVTGLANRRLFQDRLRNAVARAQRNRTRGALLYFDLDGFKQVNDTWGHEFGDWLLEEAGRRIRAGVRATDLVSRIGGDEFTLIVEDVPDERSTEVLSHKLLDALSRPFERGERRADISVSIGITYFDGRSHDLESVIREADQAMYVAKRAGKGTVRVAANPEAPPPPPERQARIRLVKDES